MLVVDAWMPTPDLDSASLRIVNLLSLLKEMSRSVTFGTDDPLSRTPPPGLLEGLGVEVLRPPATASMDAHLEREGGRYDLVILSRAHVASKYFRGARRHAPRAKVVFDTTDLAFLRGMRGAKVTGNASLLKQALQARADELALAREADCTLVVSPVEKDVLEKECPGAPVRVVSLVQPAVGSARPFAEREGIVFVGAFPHHPNVDAMASSAATCTR